MSRTLLIARPEDLPAAQRPSFTKIARSRGRVAGPFAALLHRPPVAELTATVGYDAMLACTLNAFEVRPDSGEEELDVP